MKTKNILLTIGSLIIINVFAVGQTITELSGKLSGVLKTNTYKIIKDIEVSKNDTLFIESGTKLLFAQDVGITINGLLIAKGTDDNNIIFTSYLDDEKWKGIDFTRWTNNKSIMQYCVVEHSNNSGIRICYSSPALLNVIVRENTTYTAGAGIFMMMSNSTIRSSTISNNMCLPYKNKYPAIGGGGIFMFCSNAVLENVLIADNSVYALSNHFETSGGGLCILIGQPIISNAIIVRNKGGFKGGGVYSLSNVKIVNSVISNNGSIGKGGGVYSIGKGMTLSNMIITDNLSVSGGGLYGVENICYSNVWNNMPDNFVNCEKNIGVHVSTNANGFSCDKYFNIQEDPLFAESINSNYHLIGGSPCIETGNNQFVNSTIDFDGNPRVVDGDNDGQAIVDMGVYEQAYMPVTQLTKEFCDNDSLTPYDYIEADLVESATAYEFEIFKDITLTSLIGKTKVSSRFLHLSAIRDIEWNNTYYVRVKVYVGENSGNYGKVCYINTVDSNSTIPYTHLASSFCNVNTFSLCGRVKAEEVENATQYEFEVYSDNTLKDMVVNQVSKSNVLYFSEYPILQWGKIYYTRVRAYIGSDVGNYGKVCTIGFIDEPDMPVTTTQLMPSECGKINFTLNDYVRALYVEGADEYEFEIYSEMELYGLVASQKSRSRYLHFWNVAGIEAGHIYYIRVRAYICSSVGAFGKTCLVGIMNNSGENKRMASIKSTNDDKYIFNLTVYPNPFTDEALVEIESTNNIPVTLIITDMTGKLISEQQIQVNETCKIGDDLPAGAYLLQAVSQLGERVTYKFIKAIQ